MLARVMLCLYGLLVLAASLQRGKKLSLEKRAASFLALLNLKVAWLKLRRLSVAFNLARQPNVAAPYSNIRSNLLPPLDNNSP